MKKIYGLLFLLLSITYTAAQSNDFNKLHMIYGEDAVFFNARNLAMGGSGLAGGDAASAPFLNPALLMKNAAGFMLHLGAGFNKLNEDRSYPYYDTFVGFNDYGSFSYNSNWYGSLYGNLSYTFSVAYLGQVSLAAGFQPFKDFRYDYAEEVRDPVDKSDKLLGYNSIKQEGILNEIPLVFALQPGKDLSLGIKAGFLSGSLDSTMAIEPKAAEHLEQARREHLTKELKNLPVLFALGIHYQLTERLALAGTVRSPYSVQFTNQFSTAGSDSSTAKYDRKLQYPFALSAGMEYRFQNILAARINLDFKYEAWSRFKDSRSERVFFDTYTINTGIEHIFFDKVPLRAGLLFSTLPFSEDFSRTVITIGTGFEQDNLTVDLAGGVSSFKYYQEDIFPDSIYNLDDRSDTDRVQLTRFFVRLSLNYRWM